MTINITVPLRYFGIPFGAKKYRRSIPEAWSFILDGKRRLLYIRYLSVMDIDDAIIEIIKDILRVNKYIFAAISPEDIAAIADKLAWMRLEPSTTPILSNFRYPFDAYKLASKIYALPRPDFVGGTAYEFALADGYYQEWMENPDNPKPLLQLVATFCRVYDNDIYKATGDGRRPLSSHPEHEVEVRAEHFADLDFSIVVAVLRYFEGVKKTVHEYGLASGIFEKPTDEAEQSVKPKSLFGWWTAFRGVAKGQNKTEEQVWQMSLWRVLSIMIEEKQRADEFEKQNKTQNPNG